MVLGHTDMFNKYCPPAAPSISFLSPIAVFYGGNLALVAYTSFNTVYVSHQQKHVIF